MDLLQALTAIRAALGAWDRQQIGEVEFAKRVAEALEACGGQIPDGAHIFEADNDER